jgi:hypothetical protein
MEALSQMEPKILVFAVDYDETFTACPVLFKQLILLIKSFGHSVSFVTYRDGLRAENHDICADALACGIDIVFTNGRQKSHVFQADIWLDDSPDTIVSAELLGLTYDGCLTTNDMKSDFGEN